MADYILQTLHTHLTQVLAHLLSQEGEEVHHVLSPSLEVLTQLWVLRGHTHRAGISVTFPHHHASQHNQRQRTERELVSAQHRHDNNVLGGLQLTIGLQANLVSKAIHHQRLLRLCKTNLGRDTRKPHGAGRAGTSTTLGAANHYQVGLSLGHTSGDGSHTTLGYELHAHGSCGIDVLQVEDELSQVFNRIDVVMRWRRYERDAGDGVTRLGDNIVYLEARQLSALTRLSTLSYLYLYLLRIHQVFSCHAKTS